VTGLSLTFSVNRSPYRASGFVPRPGPALGLVPANVLTRLRNGRSLTCRSGTSC